MVHQKEKGTTERKRSRGIFGNETQGRYICPPSKLQDHLSTEVDIFPSAPEPVEIGEEYISEDNDYGFEEPEIIETEPEDVHENAGYVFETDIKVSPKGSANWLKQTLSGKSELRKLMVFKEVLGEPRSLKPYTGDYFQS